MNRKIIFYTAFGLLFFLIALEFFIHRGSLIIFLGKTAIVLIILTAVTQLFTRLKDKKNSIYQYKADVESLSEAQKEFKAELDKSEERRIFLADSIPQIIWERDEKGDVVNFNKQWYQYTGAAKNGNKNNDLWKSIHQDDREKADRVWRESLQIGEPYEVEYRLRDSKGEFQWFLDRGLPMKDKNGQIVKWFGTCTNIEEQKNHHMILEQKINDRTRQLQELNDELHRSNKELENFAYIASHDLQEPLRKIRAFGDMLKKKYSQDLAGQGKEYIDRMQRASYRMQKLIDDLLNYSRVSRNPTLTESIDLYELANEVVEDLEETINNTNATIKIRELPSINGDRRQLKQLFQNLISNGIKFHKENEDPVVEIKPRFVSGDGDTEGNYVELIFADNGIGFDEKYHDKIFTIFQRLHGRIEYEGTGIGLAICKKIVDNHNGMIYAKSELGVGSEFIVALPFENANAESKQ
jgi:two-component system, chemotaxis family, CheB/CheR fusion protein